MPKLKVRELVRALNAQATGDSGGFALNDAVESSHYVNWPQGSSGNVYVDVSNAITGPWVQKQEIAAPAAASSGPALSLYQLAEPVAFARHRCGGTLGGSVTSYYDAWQ